MDVMQKDYALHSSLLSQQMFIDWWVKTEDNRLDYLRKIQSDLRAAHYNVYKKAEASQDLQSIGRQVPEGTFLPASFRGGDRFTREGFRDTMSLTTQEGQPSFLITITANPNWPEVVEECKKWGEDPSMRAEIVDRVFKLKLEQLEKKLYTDGYFGHCVANTRVIEFQKRGLPHAHIGRSRASFSNAELYLTLLCPSIVIWLKGGMIPASKIGEYIRAEIPDVHSEPRLYAIIVKHNLHHCSAIHCASSDPDCMYCKKGFPKDFSDSDEMSEDLARMIYRRRGPKNGGHEFTCPRTNKKFNNSHVVPYSPALSLEFDCHLNVEAITSVGCIKVCTILQNYKIHYSYSLTIQTLRFSSICLRYVV